MSDGARTFEALCVAMAMAPSVYARNRMFAFFERYDGKRARARASALRGIVRHLARARKVTLERAFEGISSAGPCAARFVLRYELPSVHLSRAAELTRVELAVVRVLASRAGVTCLALEPDDPRCIDEVLHHLLSVGGEGRAAEAVGAIAVAAPSASRP